MAVLIALHAFCYAARAQNIPTAIGPGSYVAVGGELSAFQVDYGQRVVEGATLFADVNPTWRIGFEAEARYLHFNTFENVTETNYFAGPRIMLRPGPIRPYVKFLVGAGKITLPVRFAEGTFLAYAPGAGVDYILNDRWTVRVVDLEYQIWPDFTFGQLHPYGISAGISFHLNPAEHIPKNADRARWR
jgi:opacity protein-like surface antigen